MTDVLSFLDDKAAPVETKVEPVIAEPVQEVKADVSRETSVEPAPAVAKEPPKEDHNPLLPKYLDTKADLRDAQKRIAEFEAKERDKAEQPDPLLDPEGYRAAQDKAIEEKLWDVRVATSEIAAKRFYGNDVVKAAFDALQAQNDPLLGMRIRRSADPWEEIVKWHKKELLLASVGDDEAAYKARIIADYVATQQPPAGEIIPPAPAKPAAPQAPPPSLSRAPASKKASDAPTGPGQGFDAVFAR